MFISIIISLSILIYIIYQFTKNFKNGVFIFLVFTTFCLPIIPLDGMNLGGISIYIQITSFLVAGFFILINSEKVILKKKSTYFLLLLITLMFLMIIYMIPTTNKDMAEMKILFFFVKTIIPVLLLTFLGPFNNQDLTKLYKLIFYGSVIVIIRVLLSDGSIDNRLNLGIDFGPLAVGRYMALSTIVAFHMRFFKNTNLNNIFKVIIIAINIYIIVLTGSRASILFLFLAVIISILLFSNNKIRNLITLSTLLIITVFTIYIAAKVVDVDSPIYRIASFIPILGDEFSNLDILKSDEARLDMFETAMKYIKESNFTGTGTSSFYRLYWIETGKYSEYPHNIILEASLEYGIFGFVLMMLIFWVAFKRIKYMISKNISYLQPLVGLILFLSLTSLVSSDIVKSFMLWGLIAIVVNFDNKATQRKELSI